jgi:hypothetical protein
MSRITVGGMEKEEVEVQPFWKTETEYVPVFYETHSLHGSQRSILQ